MVGGAGATQDECLSLEKYVIDPQIKYMITQGTPHMVERMIRSLERRCINGTNQGSNHLQPLTVLIRLGKIHMN